MSVGTNTQSSAEARPLKKALVIDLRLTTYREAYQESGQEINRSDAVVRLIVR